MEISKDKSLKNAHSKAGFTIIEMLVVVAMIAMLAGLFTLNLGGQRAGRNTKIAQNELVTNLRKIQSHTLSGRNLPGSQVAQYYIAKFDTSSGKTGSYSLQAMYRDQVGIWKLTNVESVSLPQGVVLSNLKINGASVSCALVVFQVPYGRIYMNNGCAPQSLPSDPYTVVDGDDYKKILNFVTNGGGLTVSVGSKMNISLLYGQDPGSTRTVEVNGTTGAITFQ